MENYKAFYFKKNYNFCLDENLSREILRQLRQLILLAIGPWVDLSLDGQYLYLIVVDKFYEEMVQYSLLLTYAIEGH